MVALIGVGGWIGSQRQSIASVEQQSIVLRKHIASARSSGTTAAAGNSSKPSRDKSSSEKAPLDWKKIAGQMIEMQKGDGIGDMRAVMHLQQRLQEMSKEELVSALDEIAAMDLSQESRAMLEQILMGPLIEKDPELALNRFIDRVGEKNGGFSWQLASAFGQWAQKEPEKAGLWFDQKIGDGIFDSKSLDGKSQARLQFEGSIMGILISSDPDAAARRMTSMPEDQRSEVLSGFTIHSVKEESQLAYADLVRSTVPEKDQARTISSLAGSLINGGGYEKVSEYLDRINATPAERKQTVETNAEWKIRAMNRSKPVTREDIDSMREWVTAQSPGSTDKVTGRALGNSLQGDKGIQFADAAAMAQQYSEASGNDEVIASFLEAQGKGDEANREELRTLANKVSDEKRREKILSRLK